MGFLNTDFKNRIVYRIWDSKESRFHATEDADYWHSRPTAVKLIHQMNAYKTMRVVPFRVTVTVRDMCES